MLSFYQAEYCGSESNMPGRGHEAGGLLAHITAAMGATASASRWGPPLNLRTPPPGQEHCALNNKMYAVVFGLFIFFFLTASFLLHFSQFYCDIIDIEDISLRCTFLIFFKMHSRKKVCALQLCVWWVIRAIGPCSPKAGTWAENPVAEGGGSVHFEPAAVP